MPMSKNGGRLDSRVSRNSAHCGKSTWMRDLMTSAGNIAIQRETPAIPPQKVSRTAPTKKCKIHKLQSLKLFSDTPLMLILEMPMEMPSLRHGNIRPLEMINM